MPDGCGIDRSQAPLQVGFCGRGALASGAKNASNSTPDDDVESFEITVLLTKFTARASCKETPAPSQPATLLAMMLFVTVAVYQRDG